MSPGEVAPENFKLQRASSQVALPQRWELFVQMSDERQDIKPRIGFGPTEASRQGLAPAGPYSRRFEKTCCRRTLIVRCRERPTSGMLELMADPEGRWLRAPKGVTAAVFVHGVLSSGEACWSNGGPSWPELLADEAGLSDIGIYEFSYRTEISSGNYSISDAVEALYQYLTLHGLLDLRRLVFVCHSMGGIVVRSLLVTRQMTFVERGTHIGLFLVASPSLGSNYANLLSALARLVGHSQGDALRFADNNTWLNDLDRNFMNLKESGRLVLQGQELIEDKFVILPSVFSQAVVQPFSGTRYFGDSIKIPNSDHISIAKPEVSTALQHRLLVQFIANLPEREQRAAARQAASRIRVRRTAPVEDREWREFEGRHVTIGRGPENDFVIEERQVSWEHGVFALERGVFVYRHLSRVNGTVVRGRGREIELAEDGLTEATLVNHDRITIGGVTLTVEFTLSGDGGYVTTAKAPEAAEESAGEKRAP